MKRSLVFDGQVFQTPAWHRGMGKYSLELITSLHRLNEEKGQWQSIRVIFSENMSLDQGVIESFKQLSPGVELVWLKMAKNEYDHRTVADKNRRIVEEYLSNTSNQGDQIDFIILSLMQSEVSSAFPQLPNVTNYLLFYDLIPLMFHKTYLTEPLARKSYLSKISELLKSDYYLAISKTVANDLSIALGIDTARIVSIDGASINHGSKAKEYAAPRPFILMPTGNDLRKNNRRGIEGFAKFNSTVGEKYHLVVTSIFQDFEVKEYKKITDKVIFTGNVSGEELEYLYENTSALLFPTEYEGLGMPVLEAMQKGKPVACSDISVFREISETAFSYFNPKDTDSIADGINRAIKNKKIPMTEYKRVLDKFTWSRTAELFSDFAHKAQQQPRGSVSKKQIALFAPCDSDSLEMSNLQHLYSELQRHAEVNVYSSYKKEAKLSDYLPYITRPVDLRSLVKSDSTEKSLYAFGNSKEYAVILPVALANPGVVILNDIDITQAWHAAVEKKLVHQSRLDAELSLGSKLGIKGLLVSFLASQEAVIVHNKSDFEALKSMIARLPENRRPHVYYIQKPETQLVYDELAPSDSVYDYPKSPLAYGSKSDFANYARELVKQVFKEA